MRNSRNLTLAIDVCRLSGEALVDGDLPLRVEVPDVKVAEVNHLVGVTRDGGRVGREDELWSRIRLKAVSLVDRTCVHYYSARAKTNKQYLHVDPNLEDL